MKKKLSAVPALLLAAACLGGCAAGETAPETAAPEVTETVSETVTETTAETTTETTTEETTAETTTADEKIICPNVVGMQKEEAVAALEELGLTVKIETEIDSCISQNTVICQNNETKEVTAGAEITLTVSEWEGNIFLLKSCTEESSDEKHEFTYSYDERGLLNQMTAVVSGNGWSTGFNYTITYSNDLSEITVHEEISDDEETFAADDDIWYFDVSCITKESNENDRSYSNTYYLSDTFYDIYWGKSLYKNSDDIEYSYDENNNITKALRIISSDEQFDYEYTYEPLLSELTSNDIININRLLISRLSTTKGDL